MKSGRFNNNSLVAVATAVAVAIPGAARGQVPEATVGPGSEVCAGGGEAARQYAAGQYAEAAALYEGCARATGDAGLWKKAGMARYSARQYAHAIQALGGYPRATAGAQEDAPIVAMLRDAQAQCVLVRFAVTAPAEAPRPELLRLVPRDGGERDAIVIPWSRSTVALDVWLDPGAWLGELVLPEDRRVGPQAVTVAQAGTQPVVFSVEGPVKPPEQTAPTPTPSEVVVTLGPAAALRGGVDLTWQGPTEVAPQRTQAATTRWGLVPGTWTLRATGPRFMAEPRTLEVVGPTTVAVTLRRTREDKARIAVSAATGGAALGLLIGGLVGGVRGGKEYRAAAGSFGTSGVDMDAAASAALVGIKHESTGAIAASSGIGAGIAAATIAADAHERLLGAEIGVGAALVVIGLAWLIPAKRKYYRDAVAMAEEDAEWKVDRAFLDDHRRPELAAAALLGLGAGVAAGAAIGMITRVALRPGKSRRKASVGPLAAPQAIGLNLQGQF
jgi:hypothetical protein